MMKLPSLINGNSIIIKRYDMYNFFPAIGVIILSMCAIWMLYESFMDSMREYKRLIKKLICKIKGIDERDIYARRKIH